jgi:alkylation response protein AidB-like acyl-CoA dehydrogenase
MDFSLDDVQQMLADSIEKFIANDYGFDQRQENAASDKGYSDAVWKTFAELGWTAVPFSEADGGFDGGPVETMVIMERFGHGLVVEPYLANVVLAGGVLRRAASDKQKADWLQPMIAGELQTALAFTEPQARYEVSDIATTATSNGDDFALSGHKAYVLNGGTADLFIVPARTSGKQDNKAGISLLGVPSGSKGLTVRSYATVDGLQAADLILEDVVVGPEQLIGEIDAGFAALDGAVADAIIAVCAEAVGIMTIITEKTIEYTKSRVQFGVPISSFQALQHRMVDMYTACEQSRSLMLWAAMTVASDGDDAQRAIHAIKYQIGKAGKKVGEEAVQIHGGMGVTWELDVAHYFKRLIAIGQMFGNADWHLDRLAR